MNCLLQILLIFLFNCILFSATQLQEDDVKCALREVSSGQYVCVCNATYCDTIQPVPRLPRGQYLVVTSSREGHRFNKQVLKVSNSSKIGPGIVKVDTKTSYQKILGFGGAFTDAAGINIASLPIGAQNKLIASYYSKAGIEYTIGRVPIASCDFSTHPYSYDDSPQDLSLSKFGLAPEDLSYKIPFIQRALSMTPDPLTLFASPWSAPAWMKVNNNMTGKGGLKGEPGGPYYKAWAQYFVKFLQAYSSHNISFWGLTAQNEPMDGFMDNFTFQAMAFSPENQRDFVKLDLGPALEKAGFGNISLMMLDDQRLFMLKWAEIILGDPAASKYISGIAVHWYLDALAPANILDLTHDKFPEKFIFASEACEGSMPWQQKVDLGSWSRAASYIHDIITDLNHWVSGWTDWNLALSPTGGPNWVSNFVDSPIIVDKAKGEFLKQPMFYALGHFSKFLRPGSVRVAADRSQLTSDIEVTAFLRPDGARVALLHNRGTSPKNLTLIEGTMQFPVASPANSVQTVLWW